MENQSNYQIRPTPCCQDYSGSTIRNNSIHSTYTMHGWFNYVMYCLRLSEIVTLSGDQNEVFESLVDFQRLISWNPAIKRLFLFQHLTFMVLLICILNLFHFGEGRNSTIEAFKCIMIFKQIHKNCSKTFFVLFFEV